MFNVYFNSQDNENWIRLSPTGNNVIGNCNFIFDKKEHHFEFEDSRNLVLSKHNLFSFLNYFISANFDERSTIKSINEEYKLINTKTVYHKILGLFKI